MLFVLGSCSLPTLKCCRLVLPGPFFVSFSFRVAVTRWWSLPISAPLMTLASCNDLLRVRLIIRWSTWFLSLPFGEYHESLLMLCRFLAASLRCHSCCHILLFPWLLHGWCCLFPFSHSDHSSRSSSHGVVCSLVWLVTAHRMRLCFLLG